MLNDTLTYEKRIRYSDRKSNINEYVVGIAVFSNHKLLIVRRSPHDYLGGFFELPGGNVDNDSFETTVQQELFEETGLSVKSIINWFTGFIYQTGKNTVRQCNCLVKASSNPVKLNSAEHDNYKWINKSEINNHKMTPQMRKCIKEAFKIYENL
ncbi:NUDIX domain-containing protein [Patescibacteria group bacterium]|nr:NUDIX domain-containing protein [Patescibacteria group bacterium]MBU1500001.1 NUDIX domain-containing protein [Patescibacteria group bacterium]